MGRWGLAKCLERWEQALGCMRLPVNYPCKRVPSLGVCVDEVCL